MSDSIKKLILTREYKDVEMYSCPYCKTVGTPLSFKEDSLWCDTGYQCPICHEIVLPHRSMKK